MVDTKLGPTGKFPQGKLNKTDKGELKIGIIAKDGKVIMGFGVSVAWIGMDKELAIKIANAILDKANSL